MSRDRNLEQALKREFRATDAPMTNNCLDAEALAAWMDGGLDTAAIAASEAHVSNCSRCQALVGTMARTLPLAPGSSAPGTLRLWRWWLAPIAAATAAVTLWMVVPEQQEPAQAPPVVTADQNAVARAPSPSAPKVEAAAPPAPLRDQQQSQVADTVASSANTAKPAAEARERQADLAARKEEAAQPAQESVRTAAEPSAALGAAAGASAPPPAALQKRFAVAPVEVVSPEPSSRWRAVATGLERSEDGGVSWIPIRARSDEAITGGIAVTRNICWLIGRAGLVLVTVDGVTFARVDLPERLDVTMVTATDARSATVTTADGRTFRTGDSGRTWQRN